MCVCVLSSTVFRVISGIMPPDISELIAFQERLAGVTLDGRAKIRVTFPEATTMSSVSTIQQGKAVICDESFMTDVTLSEANIHLVSAVASGHLRASGTHRRHGLRAGGGSTRTIRSGLAISRVRPSRDVGAWRKSCRGYEVRAVHCATSLEEQKAHLAKHVLLGGLVYKRVAS